LLLEFDYNGHHRIVEPHTYGVSSTGKDTLAAFQTQGTSDKGTVPDWKQFTVDKVKHLKASGTTFTGTRPGYTRGDSRMTKFMPSFSIFKKAALKSSLYFI